MSANLSVATGIFLIGVVLLAGAVGWMTNVTLLTWLPPSKWAETARFVLSFVACGLTVDLIFTVATIATLRR